MLRLTKPLSSLPVPPSRVPAVLPKHVWQFDSTSRFFHTDRLRLSGVKRHLVVHQLNALLVEDSHDVEGPEKGGLCLPQAGCTVCFLASLEPHHRCGWSQCVIFLAEKFCDFVSHSDT